MKTTRKALGALAVGLMGAGAVAACAPAAPAPAPDPDPDAVTTTANVQYACQGVGPFIGPGALYDVNPLAAQTTSVAITLPASASDGESIDVLVDVGSLSLAAAPGVVNLNAADIVAQIAVSGADGNAQVLTNNHWNGNGASIDLPTAATTATVSTGPNAFEVSTITLVTGSTGFVCNPTGAGASASIDV